MLLKQNYIKMTMMQGLLPPALKLQKIEFYVIVSWVYLDYDTLFERLTSISCNFENDLSNRVWKYHWGFGYCEQH